MGKKLRSAGVSHVVCWRSEVQDDTAREFALQFYASLNEQDPTWARDYSRAFQHAVARIGSGGGGARAKAKHVAVGAVDYVCLLSESGDERPDTGHIQQGQESDSEEEPTRNWRPPRDDNDYGALAGKHERAALTALGFEMKLGGKDIAVGQGMKLNGFLETDVFAKWGVRNYPEIWGSSGKAVEKAREVKTQRKISQLQTCVLELEQALVHRSQDMSKHAARRRCRGACPINLKCSVCGQGRKRWNCLDCKRLNCTDCVARQQHEHMESRLYECKEAIKSFV
jgi:hypothetical protein